MADTTLERTTPPSGPANIRRREDLPLIQGKGNYVDDGRKTGVLHMAFVTSQYPHARIVSIATSKAKAHPGVVEVVTGADMAHLGGMLSNLSPANPYPAQPVMPKDTVRYVGELVAGVVAESAEAAYDALELIEVEYEALPSVGSLEAAIAPGAPSILVPPPSQSGAGGAGGATPDPGIVEKKGNIAMTIPISDGDVDAAFAKADVKVSLRLVQPKLAPVPIETRGILAEPREDGGIDVTRSHQSIFLARVQLATILGLPFDKVGIHNPDVGGGFGGKTRLANEEAVVAAMALKLKKSVRWSENRDQNIITMGMGRGQIAELEAAATKDGKILGLKAEFWGDTGAYPCDWGMLWVIDAAKMITGAYKIDAIKAVVHVVTTNSSTLGPYRGAGRPEGAYCIERTIDALARELKMDPAEIRLKNFIPPDLFPYTLPSGYVYDNGEYEKTFRKLLEVANYTQLREEQKKAREQGRLVGIGLGVYVEICGLPGAAAGGGSPDSSQTTVASDGKIIVQTAAVHQGQGHATTFAHIVAEELNIPAEQVEVRMAEDDYSHSLATFASRSMAVSGNAIKLSAQKVKEQMITLAAHLLEVDPKDLEVTEGRVQVRGVPGKSYSFAQLASVAETPAEKEKLPEDLQKELLRGICSSQGFEPEASVFPWGCHLAVVEVDPEDGEVKINRYFGVDDCGTQLMPKLVEGQAHGSLAQGIGQSLFEQVVYDEKGQVLSSTLMDYAVATALDLPMFEISSTESPSPRNILGTKGVGESGCLGGPPTVTTAVLDALESLGVKHIDVPMTPERVWRTIQEAKK